MNSQTPAAGRRHAIVMGASMAGLLAARVLSEHYQRVTLIERDRLPADVENRKGVPQGRHLHVLQAKGEQIIQRLFPGLAEDLLRDGAERLDITNDLLWYHFGGYTVRYPSGLLLTAMSRPLLEAHVRRRVLGIANIRCLEQCDVTAFVTSPDRARVTGVMVHRRAEGAGTEALHADLVVDATGRGSRTPKWLEALGYARPEESNIKIGFGYTTRLYRQDPHLLPNAKAIYTQSTPPHEKRSGGLFPIEGRRWIVTLTGYDGHHAPATEAGFLAHARSLETPDIYNVVRSAEPVSDFMVHGFPSSLRRHYEKLKRFPEGLLVVGDAMCSFNPIYGQGMTVGAIETDALDRCLRAARGPIQARSFFKRAASAIENPWMVSVGEDFRYTGTDGPKPPLTDAINWYVGHVHRTTHRDPTTARTFIEVIAMTQPPTALFQPRILRQVLRYRWFGRTTLQGASSAETVS